MTIVVRRHNGQNPYGPWFDVTHDDIPHWVYEMISDEIAELGAEGGTIYRAGSRWEWKTEAINRKYNKDKGGE